MSAGRDGEVRPSNRSGRIADVAIRLYGTRDDAIVAGGLRHEGARHLRDIEVVQIAGHVKLRQIHHGSRAGEAASERRQTDAGKLDAARIRIDSRVEADPTNARGSLANRDTARIQMGVDLVLVIGIERRIAV